jgi:uncharacterized membrane protein YdjX (TVP38/TMEM64 family)
MKNQQWRRMAGKLGLTLLAVVLLLALVLILFGPELWALLVRFFQFLTDREKTSAFIESFGPAAPLIFMLIQVLQVMFAPVPGEATGFIGGYLFGVLNGFLYSSLALSLGSLINFGVGRFLGQRFVRKLIPPRHLERFDTMIKREGALVVFILFILPGFPKDYLCLFLGLSALPTKIFFFMATIGRMPGTFILSLQGAMFFDQNYLLLALATGGCSVIVLLGYQYRDKLYDWIERQNPK